MKKNMLILMLLCGGISFCGYQGAIHQIQKSDFSYSDACACCREVCCTCSEICGVGCVVTILAHTMYVNFSHDTKLCTPKVFASDKMK